MSYLVSGARVAIRPFALDDAEEFCAAARASTGLHRPWLHPPLRPEEYVPYATKLLAAGDRGDRGDKAGFLVCERQDGRIAGFVNVNNIVQGAFRCGALGYGAFVHAAGRGLLGEGLDLVLDHAFGPAMSLHRLEANIQPANTASIALVKRAGFRLEGYSPDFLHVDGAWRDHERWAITTELRDARRPGANPR
ncbi:GNAT family protein [Streptomyces sp. NPDC048057]|uniref:GNAT family N-acetyltransferase n=1 Tax=Streptomyces sp. NPDC048057 TaxID=3155628 RepID=UPI0033F08751